MLVSSHITAKSVTSKKSGLSTWVMHHMVTRLDQYEGIQNWKKRFSTVSIIHQQDAQMVR